MRYDIIIVIFSSTTGNPDRVEWNPHIAKRCLVLCNKTLMHQTGHRHGRPSIGHPSILMAHLGAISHQPMALAILQAQGKGQHLRLGGKPLPNQISFDSSTTEIARNVPLEIETLLRRITTVMRATDWNLASNACTQRTLKACTG
ncbi:MAG: hypothetical protein MK179_03715 [Pirellulaceae bacterium]|nr:hypothetical protein [Pirellulaceae bacterium]